MPIYQIAIAITAVSVISFIGVFTLALKHHYLRHLLLFLVSFSAGALLGDTFLHLLPELVEVSGLTLPLSLMILIGILTFFILEKFLRWQHCHEIDCETHNTSLATMNLVGDGLHNFIDGMIIAGSFIASPILGFATTLAVALHEIPQEIGDFGVLLHAGLSRGQALAFNFASALASFAGAFLMIIGATFIQDLAPYIIALTAGGFLYIASTDLIPELHKETSIPASLGQLIGLVLGIGVMASLLFLEG